MSFRYEIRLSGAGGQGLILVGKILYLYVLQLHLKVEYPAINLCPTHLVSTIGSLLGRFSKRILPINSIHSLADINTVE